MKRAIHILYSACVVGMIFLVVFLCKEFRDDVYKAREDTGYEYLTAYKRVQIEDKNAPAGVRNEYIISDLYLPEGGRTLMFYTIHQKVKVYVGEGLVYSLRPAANNLFGKTPGSTWNVIPLYEKDKGKEIRIVLTPVYKSSIDIIPDFYLGSQVSICGEIVKRNVLYIILSMLAVIIGIVFIIFNCWNKSMDKGLFMLGMFSVNIGLWKISDIDAVALLFPDSIALAYIPFITLMLMIIPFVSYIRSLFLQDRKIWYLPCIMSILSMISSVGLQLFGIADMRQTLWMVHLVIGTVLIIGIIMLLWEMHISGWNSRLKRMVIGIGACLLGTVIDIVIYYISKGTYMTVVGMMGFLTYIIVMGISSVKEARTLMLIGRNADHYKQMAYHDVLTGLYNRAAYARDIEKPDLKRKHCILVMFDLNNLKHCNDTYGHEKGDLYILNSAKLIEEIFGNCGKCYRMGGDEFCVLLEQIPIEKCRKMVEKLTSRTEEWNQTDEEEFKIHIACGYALYNEKEDYDLGDTLRRADRMMYHEKFRMKEAVD